MEKTAHGREIPIRGYCFSVEGKNPADCHKIVDGSCTVYPSPSSWINPEVGRGCSFSPVERPVETKLKVRVGQQKGKRKKK